MTSRGAKIADLLWAPLVALQFLTRIPVSNLPDAAYNPPTKRLSFAFYPVVGVLVGGIGAGVWLGASRLGLPPLAASALTAAVTAVVTGAFHEDGLADTADGLGPHDRARALEVMRDSRIGTFGAVALWMILTVKASALAALPIGQVWRTIICAHALARWSPVALMRCLPQAQTTPGLGAQTAALVSNSAFAAATVVAALIVFAVEPRYALRFGLAAVTIAVLSGTFYLRKFGGVTGDCLGATNQLIEAAVLLAPFAHM